MFSDVIRLRNSGLRRKRSLRTFLCSIVLAGSVICPAWGQSASLTMTATDPDGTNTGTAKLGSAVNLTTSVVNGAISPRAWTLQGAGTLTPNGTNNSGAAYTAPQTMPASSSVTVTATTTASPIVSTSYTFTLINPAPTLKSASPNQAIAGATTPITLTGTGFVSSTVVLVNGSAVTSTYQSPTSIVAQIAGQASGSLSVVAKNPTPGGGASAANSIPVGSVSLTATDADGTNTGTARLGVPVNLASSVTDMPTSYRTWTLQGAGTLSGSVSANNYGTILYTPPSVMPANPSVTIKVATTSPVATTTYTLALLNPVPVAQSLAPNQAAAGATIPIQVNGSGFVPGTSILVNGKAAPTTYQSATTVIAQVTAAAGATGTLSVQAQNPAPGGTTSMALQLSIATLPITATDPDGTNVGTARLGVPVNFTTVDTDTIYPARAWAVEGVGTITQSGGSHPNATYTPPQIMPANPKVQVSVWLQFYPTLSSHYYFTLINPVPVVTSASPAQLLTGGTQTVTLTGSGFVPGTTVSFNGQTLPIGYVSYNQATVQVPVANNATGILSFQVQNPAPGGGAGTTFTESVAPVSITMTAIGHDGINTKIAEMDFSVALSATVNGSMQTAVTWSLTGWGSLSSAHVYTPPAVYPANPHWAVVRVTLVSNPKIYLDYGMDILNPMPTIAALSPSIVPAGGTTAVTIIGTGFVPTTVAEVNSEAVPTTYVSPTSVVAQINVNASATGELSLQVNTPNQSGGLSDSFPLAIATPVSLSTAGRILDQTTFGPTTSLVQHVQNEGVTAWLTEQFNTPQTVLPAIPAVIPAYCAGTVELAGCFESNWWQTVITGNDQLRQRVAFALSQLFVASTRDGISEQSATTYANMLAADAFTNWYTIMNDVTVSPAMGSYLNMVNSTAPTGGLIANENFARENMQLFNMGLDLLNQDGSLQLDGNGNPIPAYTESQVEAFSRVFTGWTYPNADGSNPGTVNWTQNPLLPMVAVEHLHDENSKTLLNGTTLPTGQTAEEDLAQGLTNVFQHPNVPPFVSLQLIQHLVKSNPSPAYISRVAAVFADDGNGVRGDMKAVLTAIFTDPEARAGDTAEQLSDGHLREPILWITGMWRGLGVVNVDPNNYWQSLSNLSADLGEQPFHSPAVFNFFPPNYVIPGTSLNAPEFGIENTATVMSRLNLANSLVFNAFTTFNVDLSMTSPLGQVYTSQGSPGVVQALNNLFLYGMMDNATATAITNEITTAPGVTPAEQIRLAVYLVVTSSEYKVIH
jgi:uncharacterized protein (DUF1800 family)